MDVKSCIEAYQTLAKDIFTPRRRTYIGGARLHKILGSSTFSAEKLEGGIKKIIKDNGQNTRSSDRDAARTGVGRTDPADFNRTDPTRPDVVENGVGSVSHAQSNRAGSPRPNVAPDAVPGIGSLLEELPMLAEGGHRCKV